ncbi:lipopolysaccharide biosynthesis protein [Tenacibaculum sp. A30]|uniref:lipopolysaccharide biosynthesis protein n=1 Tax=Tenacibaculum sp. A30 TaxID=3442644 RepID=UPI003EBCF465
MSLKNKTIIGVFWGAVEKFLGYGIQFFFNIILARLLTPEDFGVIGLLVVFTALSQVITDSGFSQALIRKEEVTQEEYSSIFFLNIFLGCLLYSLLFIGAPFIADFYNYPKLSNISRIVFLIIIVNSFGVVLNAIIVREINFKVLAKRTILSNLLSGIIGVFFAYKGFGVWSLVIQLVLSAFFKIILLWQFTNWRPSLYFKLSPIKEMFSFSFYIMLSKALDVLASNLQILLIGKFYSKKDLGYYTQAYTLESMPATTITTVVKNVTYPSISKIKDDINQVKNAYRKVITISCFVVFPLMAILMLTGDLIIPLLLSNKWEPSIQYFKPLCLIGAVFPLYSIGMNLFMVTGNTKKLFKVSMTKRVITILFIVISVSYGIYALVWGQIVAAIINSIITMYYSGKEINYTFKEQLKDISKIFLVSLTMFLSILLAKKYILIVNDFYVLVSSSLIGLIVYVLLSKLFKIEAFVNVMSILQLKK